MNNQARSKYLASFSVRHNSSHGSAASRLLFNLAAFCIVIGFFVLMVWGTGEITEPLSIAVQKPLSLDKSKLISYSFQTLFRMMLAACISLVVAIIYALLAAKNKRAEQIMIPLLDVLQSVPILGYISFTVAGFIALFPNSILGAELAAIFAIFTSQVWNMIFSFYQSLKTIPKELVEAAKVLKLSGWQRFWKVELPFGIPGLVWNTTVSISSGWFFIVAAEAVTVGSFKLNLEGIGSYIALAISEKDMPAIASAVGAMVVVILLYDQFIMRPIIAWSDKFRYEMTASSNIPRSWVLTIFRRSNMVQKALIPFRYLANFIINLPIVKPYELNRVKVKRSLTSKYSGLIDYGWYGVILLMLIASGYHLFDFLHNHLGWDEVVKVFTLAVITTIRVFIVIIFASIVWVPIGVCVGSSQQLTRCVQPLAQFLSSFPANLLFPVAVILVTNYKLNPDIWLSFLMVMGTQWYILFNVIAASASIPTEFKETVQIFKIKGWLWWYRVMIPAIAPYYLTGVITASGGAWNASIVAEIVSYGDITVSAHGLGSYIAVMTVTADFQRIVLGIGMMCLFVVVINKFFWQPLHDYASKKFQL